MLQEISTNCIVLIVEALGGRSTLKINFTEVAVRSV